jgi:hypothetical protein
MLKFGDKTFFFQEKITPPLNKVQWSFPPQKNTFPQILQCLILTLLNELFPSLFQVEQEVLQQLHLL